MNRSGCTSAPRHRPHAFASRGLYHARRRHGPCIYWIGLPSPQTQLRVASTRPTPSPSNGCTFEMGAHRKSEPIQDLRHRARAMLGSLRGHASVWLVPAGLRLLGRWRSAGPARLELDSHRSAGTTRTGAENGDGRIELIIIAPPVYARRWWFSLSLPGAITDWFQLARQASDSMLSENLAAGFVNFTCVDPLKDHSSRGNSSGSWRLAWLRWP